MSKQHVIQMPPKSAIAQWERGKDADKFSVQDMLTGKSSGFFLVEDDFAILTALLRYNFSTGRQMTMLLAEETAKRDVQRRLLVLFNNGLIERRWGMYRTTPMPITLPNGETGTRFKNIKEYIFALSQKGFDLLAQSEEELAVAWQANWLPKALTNSRKNSLRHELGRNDVCLAMFGALRALGRPAIDWRGPREAFHRYVPGSPGAAALMAEPDSVLILDNGHPLFLEYERSGRPERFYKKMVNMRIYIAAGGWKQRYIGRPWVVYAIPDGLGTQKRGAYGSLLKQAIMGNAMRYLLLDQASWETGTWDAVGPDGLIVPLWKTVLSE